MVFQKGNTLSVGRKCSDATKLKISLARLGQPGYWLGKHRSEEVKNKLLETHLGIPRSEETKLKISLAGMGREVSEELKAKMSLRLTGSGNPMWKGGRCNATRGYIYIWNPTHPFARKNGYIYEHRLVMEEFLDRYLTKEEVVHHINEITNDNQIENLMLFANNGEHKKHHLLLKKVS